MHRLCFLIHCGKVYIFEFNLSSANLTKWSKHIQTIRREFSSNFPTNCLTLFDHFVGLALKESIYQLHKHTALRLPFPCISISHSTHFPKSEYNFISKLITQSINSVMKEAPVTQQLVHRFVEQQFLYDKHQLGMTGNKFYMAWFLYERNLCHERVNSSSNKFYPSAHPELTQLLQNF